jgi:LPS sulfotransferase NodH
MGRRVSEPTTDPYLICATPRSGSTLLCDLLTATGVAGRPEEYFQLLPVVGRARHPREYLGPVWAGEIEAILGERSPVDDEPTQLEQRGVATFPEYLERVREAATTPNGVFGAKVMWGYFPGLVWHLAGDGADVDDAPALLEAQFPGLRYVHVTRRDTERQAMSLWRALQTWTWRADQVPRTARSIVFCRRAIEYLAASLEADNEAWRAWYDRNGIRPAITVVYEDVAADPDGGVREVLDALGLGVPQGHRAAPRLRPQADAVTEEWRDLLRS